MRPYTATPPLNELQHESRILAALTAAGLSGPEARAVAAARWHRMSADAAVCEIAGRGVDLDKHTLTDYLLDTFAPRTTFDDGEPITADGIGWNRRHVNASIEWALARGRAVVRGDAAAGGPDAPAVVTVADALESLRSPLLPTRVVAGALLGMSAGAGCKLAGETEEDFDMIVRPKIAALLTAAMEGDGAAVDELAGLLTTDPAEAFRPKDNRRARRARRAK